MSWKRDMNEVGPAVDVRADPARGDVHRSGDRLRGIHVNAHQFGLLAALGRDVEQRTAGGRIAVQVDRPDVENAYRLVPVAAQVQPPGRDLDRYADRLGPVDDVDGVVGEQVRHPVLVRPAQRVPIGPGEYLVLVQELETFDPYHLDRGFAFGGSDLVGDRILVYQFGHRDVPDHQPGRDEYGGDRRGHPYPRPA